jgi:hypothetical protein
MTLAHRQNHINDIELSNGTLNGTIRFNSAPSTGTFSRPMAHATLSHRSKVCCHCEGHLNHSVDEDDSTVELQDDPAFLKRSGLNEESESDI